MRWMLGEIGKVLRTLFLWALLFITAGIALFMGADVYLSSKYLASPLVRQFEYGNAKNIDATAILKTHVSAGDLSEYRLEQVLRDVHGFKCQPVNGVSRCLYRKKGLVNCVHAIAVALSYDDSHALRAATAETAFACDAF